MTYDSRQKAWLWSAIPPLMTALFIAFFGSNVPFWDEWDLGPLIEKLALHQATFADFFQPQQEHRFVLPKLILAPLALATHWNVIVELWLSFAVALAGYAGLLLLIRRGESGRLFVTTLAYFSLAAYENWLGGWQFSWFLTNTLVIWAVVAARSIRNRALQIACAGLLCALASFSISYGIASWIALVPLLWFPVRDGERVISRALTNAVWAALFATALVLYLYRFHPKRGGVPCDSIICWIMYPLTVLGSPLSRTIALAIAAGATLVITFAVAAGRALQRQERDAVPWIAIGLFAIGFTALNAIGRSGLGPEQALTSRYLTPASFLLIAVINLVTLRRFVFITVCVALVTQSLTSIPIGWQIKRARDEVCVCVDLLLVNDSADCLPSIAESAAMLRGGAIPVHRIGLRPLVTASDFIAAPQARGSIDGVTPLTPTQHPALRASGQIDLPSKGLYAVVATVRGERRIVAADLVRGPGSSRWNLLLPPHVVQRNSAFEAWLFVPTERKLHRIGDIPLEQRLLRPHAAAAVTEVVVGELGGDTAARRALQESDLD